MSTSSIHVKKRRFDQLPTLPAERRGVATYARDSASRTASLAWNRNAGTVPGYLAISAMHYPATPLNMLPFSSGRTPSATCDNEYTTDSIASSANDDCVKSAATSEGFSEGMQAGHEAAFSLAGNAQAAQAIGP